jgi:hypothetical protein
LLWPIMSRTGIPAVRYYVPRAVVDLAGNILTSMNYSSILVVLNPFC